VPRTAAPWPPAIPDRWPPFTGTTRWPAQPFRYRQWPGILVLACVPMALVGFLLVCGFDYFVGRK